jgi:hypothetical protein
MNCGGAKREQWLQDRMQELLPTSYFHIVFTLPQELRSLCMGNRKTMFSLLFDASHYTLTHLAANAKWLGAQPGIISILHSNGQDLSFHPHIHCIVSGGGIDKNGMWVKEKRANGKFIFPRTMLEETYKKYFLQKLLHLHAKNKLQIKDADDFKQTIITVEQMRWNVHANAPMGGPAQVLEYIGRYTHKVAITAHRIIEITDDTITFKYKDYADGHKEKIMELTHEEFLRRFEQHILPKGFVKIRHAGYLTARNKTARIAAVLAQLHLPDAKPKVKIPAPILVLMKSGIDITLCPTCKVGKLILVATFIKLNGQMVNINDIKNRGSPYKKLAKTL